MERVLRHLSRAGKFEIWRGVWTTLMLTAICNAHGVVLAAASVAAAEDMVADAIAKLKEVGSTVGAEKTHWTSHPNMVDTSTVVHGLSVLREEALEFVDRRCVWMETRGTLLRTDQFKRTRAWQHGEPMANRIGFIMALGKLRLSIVKSTMWQASLWSV